MYLLMNTLLTNVFSPLETQTHDRTVHEKVETKLSCLDQCYLSKGETRYCDSINVYSLHFDSARLGRLFQ